MSAWRPSLKKCYQGWLTGSQFSVRVAIDLKWADRADRRRSASRAGSKSGRGDPLEAIPAGCLAVADVRWDNVGKVGGMAMFDCSTQDPEVDSAGALAAPPAAHAIKES